MAYCFILYKNQMNVKHILITKLNIYIRSILFSIQSIYSTCVVFQVDGLGTYSNVAVYAALVLSCMFLPTFIIKTFTVKWGLVMCMFCYTAYIATQFYPQFYTIIPGAIIVGIGAAPMWSAKCTYLTQVRISKISSKRYTALLHIFLNMCTYDFASLNLHFRLEIDMLS